MNRGESLLRVVVLALVALLSSACSVPQAQPTVTLIPTNTAKPVPTGTPALTPTSRPTVTPVPAPEVAGQLIDAVTEAPVKEARVLLCKQGADTSCCIDQELSAVTDADGTFNIQLPGPGDYVVLYSQADALSEWDGLCIDYASLRTLWDSMGGMMSARCRQDDESGYYLFPGQQLALVWVEDRPLAVSVSDGVTEIRLAVWTGSSEPCGQFRPIR